MLLALTFDPWDNGKIVVDCPQCKGEGYLNVEGKRFQKKCPRCHGGGKTYEDPVK